MIDWIRADDNSRNWPEGAVIAFYPNDGKSGSGNAVSAYRQEDGSFSCEWVGEAKPTHFFFLPPEPIDMDERYGH